MLSFNTTALPRGFAEYLCLELHIVYQVGITFKNPEKSSLLDNNSSQQPWWFYGKVQEQAEHSAYYYQGEELDKKA